MVGTCSTKLVRLFALCGAFLALLACSKPAPAPEAHVPFGANIPTSSSVVDVHSFGVVGDGVTVEDAAFQKAVNAVAGSGKSLLVSAGTYLIHTTISVPSNTTIVGAPGAVIVGNLTSGAGSTKATFLATWTANGVNSTLAANNVVGAKTISSNASYAAGQQFVLQSASHVFQEAMYTVRSVSGIGPYTLTLDRPVLLQFATNDAITGLGTSIPKNVHLIGNGLLMTGTPNRHAEFAGCYQCSIEGVRADTSLGAATGGDYWFSFDVGGVENIFRDMHLDIGGASSEYGLALESNERSRIVESHVLNAGAVGYLLIDDIQCDVIGSSAHGCATGIQLSGEDAVVGCISDRIIGGSYSANSSFGVQFSGGTIRSAAIGVSANRNGNTGFYFDGTGSAQTGNRLTNVEGNENVNYGIYLASGSAGSVVNGAHVSNNGSFGLLVQDDATLSGISASNSLVPAGAGQSSQTTIAASAGNITLSGLFIKDTQNSTNVNVLVTAGTLDLNNAKILVAPNNYGLETRGSAILRVSHTLVKSVGSPTGENGVQANSSGSTIELGAGVDLTGCANPILAGTGTVAMNQGRGVFTSAIATGTETLSQVQARSDVIQTSQSLSGNVTENVPAGIPGLRYVVFDNATLNAHTWSVGVTGGTSISIGAGKRAVLESDGTNMQRVSPDT